MAGITRRLCIAAVAACLGASAAQADVWYCKLAEEGRMKGIGTDMLLQFVDGGEAVRVVDLHAIVNKEPPAETEVTGRSGQRIDFRWRRMTKGRSSLGTSASAAVNYSAIFFGDRKRIMVRSKPSGFANTWRAEGRCRPVTEREKARAGLG